MTVLIIAPHADDEILGAGGTIAKHIARGEEVVVAILTGHGPGSHPLWGREKWDTVRDEARNAHLLLGVKYTIFKDLPAVLVPEIATHVVNETVMQVVTEVEPNILYIPYLYDLHKDHRSLAYACNVSWRPNNPIAKNIFSIYMYETLSETHWSIPYLESGFQPNVFVDISEFINIKCRALSLYQSQITDFPNCRSIEAIQALAKFRGACAGMKAAEAFYLVRKFE